MRGNSFIKRLRPAINFIIHGAGGVRIMTCEKCGSINILPVTGTSDYAEIIPDLKEQNVRRIWRETNICKHCGAYVMELQYWVWN